MLILLVFVESESMDNRRDWQETRWAANGPKRCPSFKSIRATISRDYTEKQSSHRQILLLLLFNSADLLLHHIWVHRVEQISFRHLLQKKCQIHPMRKICSSFLSSSHVPFNDFGWSCLRRDMAIECLCIRVYVWRRRRREKKANEKDAHTCIYIYAI